MKNNNVINLGIIGILLLIVFASGCISSSTNETKTYSDGVMSFNYPGYFNSTQTAETNSSSFQIMASLESRNMLNIQFIDVIKNKTDVTVTEARDKSISKVKNDSPSIEILSVTTETNPNNIVVERYSYVNKGIISETYNIMYFKINDDVYGIGVQGPDLFKEKIQNTANIIFQSIK